MTTTAVRPPERRTTNRGADGRAIDVSIGERVLPARRSLRGHRTTIRKRRARRLPAMPPGRGTTLGTVKMSLGWELVALQLPGLWEGREGRSGLLEIR